MLVDDSAVIRGALSKMLKDATNIDIVASVSNGQVAIEKAASLRPDIVILDVEMPVMDGLTALPQLLKASPRSKVIMFSALTAQGADTTIKALALGAVECLVKPSAAEARGDEFKNHLIKLLTSLYPGRKERAEIKAPARSESAQPKKSLLSASYSLHKNAGDYTGPPDLVAIGSSTGGPNALFEVCANLKGLNCPIVITQHMPPTFTTILAEHITSKSGLPTAEAEDGMVLEKGKAYL